MILSLLNQLLFVALATTCDQKINPHSFACVDETFFGNHFPMVDLSEQRVQGTWKFLTIAVPDGSALDFQPISGPNPRKPSGVRNLQDHSKAGPLVWTGDRIQFQNWKQERSDLDSEKIKFRDQWTLQSQFPDGTFLQCRVFIRSEADHLLCLWFEKNGAEFEKRGYLGFLKSP